MTYKIPFILNFDNDTSSLIDQGPNSCATCDEGDISCPPNGDYAVDE